MAGHDNHGQTPAAWTGVTIVLIGFCVGGAYTVLAEPLGVLAGLGIVALGGIVGLIMRSMGLGADRSAPPARPAAAAAPEAAAPEAVEVAEPKAAVSG